jgi:Putative abortive phage resistance protein AbiGi, antitoxin
MSKYVSDELTHFAGAGRANDEERYNLLLNTIIRSGTLRDLKYESVPKTPITFLQIDKRDGRSDRENYFPNPYFDVNVDAPMTSNKFIDPEMICFCDIPYEPVELFRIHTAKYKRFGIAFKREFLIRQGANPVFYVATSSATPLRIVGDGGDLCDFFEDESIESLVTGVWNRSDFFDCLRRRVIAAIELTRTLWERDAARY